MILKSLRLYNFRVFSEQGFQPEAGLNLLLGPNGAGKTAVLEALHLLSAARSFRVKREYELCKWGNSECLIDGQFVTDDSHNRRLGLSWRRKDGEWQKKAQFQGDSVARLADFLGCVPLSLFTPDDLALVNGSPSVRRRYLDLILSKLSPLHLQDLARLKKVLASRNSLLRQKRPRSECKPWDKLLFQLATSVGRRREQLARDLQFHCQQFFAHLTGGEKSLKLEYKRCWPQDPDEFEYRLAEVYERELQRGLSMLSPQKDDLDIQQEERALRIYGSQGEQRLLALCLRLAEAKHLAEEKQEQSILLLDDALGELDPQKKAALLQLLPQFSQVFLTSASPVDLAGQDFHLHSVEAGLIS